MELCQLLLLPQKVHHPRVAARLNLVNVKAPEVELRGEQLRAHFLRHVQLGILSIINNRREDGGITFEAQLRYIHGIDGLQMRSSFGCMFPSGQHRLQLGDSGAGCAGQQELLPVDTDADSFLGPIKGRGKQLLHNVFADVAVQVWLDGILEIFPSFDFFHFRMISGDSDNTAKEEQKLRRFANQDISSHRVPELKSIPMSCRHFVLTTVFHVQQNRQQHKHHRHKSKRAIYNYKKKTRPKKKLQSFSTPELEQGILRIRVSAEE